MAQFSGASSAGYQQITGISAATGLTIPAGSARAIIQCEAQPVRWRDDGTDPTATVGMRLDVGDVLDFDANLPKIKFIEEISGAILNVVYYKA